MTPIINLSNAGLIIHVIFLVECVKSTGGFETLVLTKLLDIMLNVERFRLVSLQFLSIIWLDMYRRLAKAAFLVLRVSA